MIVHHPSFPEITKEISEAALKGHLAAGWMQPRAAEKSTPHTEK